MHPSRKSPPSFGRRLVNRFWITVNQLTPRNRAGDQFISWLWFVRYQRRLPDPRRRWFNDMLYAIKASDEIIEPLRVFTTDKEFVKLYVKAMVGDAFNIPTIAVLRSFEECRAYAFPDRCVIKPTHLSGTVILRRAGEPIDFDRIGRWFKRNIYVGTREANYRALTPKVIVEPYVFDNDNPNDYKFFCMNGEPRLIQVDSDRYTAHTRSLFDTHWNQLPYSFVYPLTVPPPPVPGNLAPMLDIARKLSAKFGFVRVDLYSDGREIRVGELTHCAENAQGKFHPEGSEVAASALLFGDVRP
jgi:hypothetical protein